MQSVAREAEIDVVPLAKPQAMGRAELEGVELDAALDTVPKPVDGNPVAIPATGLDLQVGAANANAYRRHSRGLTAAFGMDIRSRNGG